MSTTTAKRARRLPLLLLAIGVLMIALGGCAFDHRTIETGVSQDALSAGGEPYFNVGNVTYQVQVSRQLNPFASDDVQYLAGVPGAQNLSPTQLWFGVFMWAKNQMDTPQQSADRFAIVDSNGTVYPETPLNPSLNLFAWTSQSLAQNEIEPEAGSVASNGSTGGGLVLFKLTTAVYSNRPLTLLIYAPGQTKPARVSLDL